MLRASSTWFGVISSTSTLLCAAELASKSSKRKKDRLLHMIHPSDAIRYAGLDKRKSAAKRSRYAMPTRNGRRLQQRALSMLRGRVDESKLSVPERLDLARAEHVRLKAVKQAERYRRLPRFVSKEFETKFFFREEDLSEFSTKGRGPGGQATNRRMQTCEIKHLPSGIIVRCSKFPSLWMNRKMARRLMDLRIEEYHLGPESRLGERRVLVKKREAIRKRRRRRMMIRAEMEKSAVIPDLYGFLSADASLPKGIALEEVGSDSAVKVDAFFNDLCGRWWEMVNFHRDTAGDAQGDGPLLLNEGEATDPQRAVLPVWFTMLFPCGLEAMAPVVSILPPVEAPPADAVVSDGDAAVIDADENAAAAAAAAAAGGASPEDGTLEVIPEAEGQKETEISDEEKVRLWEGKLRQRISRAIARRQQASVERCRHDERCCRYVKLAFRCSLEMFGLRAEEAQDKNGKTVLRVSPDGLLWREHGRRLHMEDGRLDPVAGAVLFRMFRSMRWMKLDLEALALRRFAIQQRKAQESRERSQQSKWPRQLCSAFARAEGLAQHSA